MSESSSDISSALQRIHQLDAELSTSTDQSNNAENAQNDEFSTNNDYNSKQILNDSDSSEDIRSTQAHSDSISNFCALFNKKVGVRTNSLDEVLEIVDILVSNHAAKEPYQENETEAVSKYKERIKLLRNKNKELQNQIHQSEIQNSSLQTNYDHLKYENCRLEESLSDVQQMLASAQQEVSDLKERSSRTKNSKDLLESTVSNLGDLVQSQLDDSTTIIQQRDMLIKIINKQNSALQQYEQILSKNKEESLQNSMNNYNFVSKEDNIENNEDSDLPSALAVISKSTENFSNLDIKSNISDICNDSTSPIISRIESVVSYICRIANDAFLSRRDSLDQIDQLKTDLNDMKSRCFEIISLFDEEIQFMQRLAHSNDIQSCVFFREDQNKVLPIEQSTKEELIKHCARVNRYIEETIPQINMDEMTDAFSQYELLQPTEIFNLLNANTLEKKLIDFSSRIKNKDGKNSIELKELFCLFAAQAFTNDILQNHSVELRMRYELAQREIQQLKLDLEETKEPIRSMKKVINHYNRRENKVRRLLIKVCDVENNDADLLTIVKDIAGRIAENKIGRPEKIMKELNSVVEEKTQLTETLNKQLKNIETDLVKTEKLFQSKQEEYLKTIENQKNEIENEKKMNNEMNIRIEEVQNQLTQITESYNDLRANQQNEIKNVQESSDSRIQSLTVQLENKISRVKELENNCESLVAKLEECKRAKKEAKERVEYLEAVNLKSVNELKEKSKNLREQYEQTTIQIQQQLQAAKENYNQMQEETRQLQSRNEELCAELSNCQINKKSIELRAKALEDRCETQRQTLVSQYEAKTKSFETQIEAKYNQLVEDQSRLLNEFVRHFNEELNGHFETTDFDGTLRTFLQYFLAELDSKHHAQVVYEETAADVLKVQKLLKISECSDLYNPVSALVKANKEMQQKVKDCEDGKIEAENMSTEYCKQMRKVQSQIASLRQWESWARRLHRIVHEACCTTYSSDQLRLSLEESLLSSVSHRTLLCRLASLREQKKALTNFDRDALIKRDSFTKPPSWATLTAISTFIRRMQKVSGCIPIDTQTNSVSSLELSCGTVETPKRKKNRSQHGLTDRPQKKPAALFKHI